MVSILGFWVLLWISRWFLLFSFESKYSVLHLGRSTSSCFGGKSWRIASINAYSPRHVACYPVGWNQLFYAAIRHPSHSDSPPHSPEVHACFRSIVKIVVIANILMIDFMWWHCGHVSVLFQYLPPFFFVCWLWAFVFRCITFCKLTLFHIALPLLAFYGWH